MNMNFTAKAIQSLNVSDIEGPFHHTTWLERGKEKIHFFPLS